MDLVQKWISKNKQSIIKDSKNILSKKLMLIGLILIPSILFVLYVGAFYQPMDNLDQTKILLINEDQKEFSKTIENTLLATNAYKFSTANYAYALTQIQEGKAYGAIVIPSGTSDRISEGKNVEIFFVVDEQQSYIVARVLNSYFSAAIDKINLKIKEQTLSETSNALNLISTQEKTSALALNQLNLGTQKIIQGEEEIKSSTQKISEYTNEISLANNTLSDALYGGGTSQNKLINGLTDAKSASIAISNGAGQLYPLSDSLTAIINSDSNISTSNKTTLLYLIAAQKSGLLQIKSGADALSSGLLTARAGVNQAQNGMYLAADNAQKISSETKTLAYNTEKVSQGVTELINGNNKVLNGEELLKEKEQKLAEQLVTASSTLENSPKITLDIREANKNNYGTFFATAFIILGLFLGAASGYAFLKTSKIKNEAIFSIIIAAMQTVVITVFYILMNFPSNGGIISLFFLLLIINLVFVSICRGIALIISNDFDFAHLQLYSPIVSLLAVFMISSGGTLWPQQTLNPPFDLFTPFIPFNYAVSATKINTLGGIIPLTQIGLLIIFAVIFTLLPIAKEVIQKRFLSN